MDIARSLRTARQSAGLTQSALAARSGTSQATISAYESERKQPSVATLERLLSACGVALGVGAPTTVRRPTAEQLERAGRGLQDVVELAALLPTRHERVLRYPRLPTGTPGR